VFEDEAGEFVMFKKTKRAVSISGIIWVGLSHSAFAGAMGVPAPIIGAGLPLLLVAAGAYFVVRLIRAGRGD
jgi:hypothetical protein